MTAGAGPAVPWESAAQEPRVHPLRRALAVTLLAAVPIAVLGIEAGGWMTLRGARNDAAALAAAHHWQEAVGVERAAAERNGPVYLLGRAVAGDPAIAAERTTLDWARSLAAAGDLDRALGLVDGLRADPDTDPGVATDAIRERAQLLLDAARGAQAAHHEADAASFLDRLADGAPPADLAAAADALRRQVAVPAAAQLTAAGSGVRAVTLLDGLTGADAATRQAAAALLPAALLAAGREQVAAGAPAAARDALQRLVSTAPHAPEAATARTLLAAPQWVSGTLLRPDGHPAVGVAVRLAAGFRRLGGVDFTVTGPVYGGRTDRHGGFRITGVPLGQQLVFQFADADGWALLVDDSHNPAYSVTLSPLAGADLGFVREP